jgi:drug/metabolite transporter (DMT)-like permease
VCGTKTFVNQGAQQPWCRSALPRNPIMSSRSTSEEREDKEDENLLQKPPAQRNLPASDSVPIKVQGMPMLRLARNYVALLSVPLLWGTFTPSMKLLLDHKHAPPVILTNLLSHTVGAVALACLWLLEAVPRQQCLPIMDEDRHPPTKRRMALASLELGIYLFFGQLTQLLGLGGTSATTNAILVQSSVVIVPLCEPARGLSRCSRVLPSLLALAGIAAITVAPQLVTVSPPSPHTSPETSVGHRLADGSHARTEGEGDPSQTTFGVLCSLASAVFYALHTLRLSEYGDVEATVQATGQVAFNAVLDLVAVPISSILAGGNCLQWLTHANMSAIHRLGIAAVWNGVFIVGATTWAMSYAQRKLPASQAVLAYALEPLFAAVFAATFLHDAIGPLQAAGGILIVAANMLMACRSPGGDGGGGGGAWHI